LLDIHKIEEDDFFRRLSIYLGIDTGFYLTPNAGQSLLVRFRLATVNKDSERNRDPITIIIEGSNSDQLEKGASWKLIYNGPSGIAKNTHRSTYGDFVDIHNTISYASYRFLVTKKRGIDVSVEYSEVEFYGSRNCSESTTQIPSTKGKYCIVYPC